ncbi:MAG: PKD domain-containing protein [Bacteroidota bacterium]
MKLFYFLIFSLSLLRVDAQKFTNKGKEFWVGYGQNQLFTASSPNLQSMVLYLSADAPATVTVSVNGTGWTRTYAIPANSVTVSDLLPKSGAEDCRIMTEGFYTKAIHIVSSVPISAFAHTYGQYSSGGTMLLPVDSYGYNYISVNPEQSSDNHSWFYVVASENNTKVRITPTRLTVGNRPLNVPFEVSLNKGEIYNVMARIVAGSGNDISGSKVVSIPGADGNCHPVAVFSGCSRTHVCASSDPLNTGSDFVMQQIFPTNAWGSRFITALTSKSTSASSLNNNKFRAYIRDANTLVRKNGVLVTGLINNAYYDFLSTTGDVITSTRPILLAQFIPSANGCGTDGLGDPEMFCLVPVEQAINNISFFSSSRENIEVNYLTLIVPTNGISSLLIDGSNSFDHTYPHPYATGHTVVVKKFQVPNLQHTAYSDSAFTAIAYGLGQFESYGYNAGAHIDNLEAAVVLKNEFAPTYSAYTCTKTPFHPVLKTVYKPSSIFWPLSRVAGLSPNADITINNPAPTDSVTETGRKYYLYQLPGDYYFNHTGNDTIPVTLTNMATENCTYSISTYMALTIKPAPTANFTTLATACSKDSIRFTHTSPNSQLINKWKWNFGDGGTDTVANPVKAYAVTGDYNVTLKIIKANDGCVGDTVKPVHINALPIPAFTLPQNICMPNGSAVFTNNSTMPNANPSSLTFDWSFGDGTRSVITNPTHAYNSNGPFTVQLKAISQQGCADSITQVLSSFLDKPVAAFVLPQNICMPNGKAVFTNQSTLPNGNASTLVFDWNFGDGNHSAAKDPDHIYTSNGPFTIVLKSTSAQGCIDSSTQVLSSFSNKPQAAFALPQNICMPNGNALFTNNSVLPNGNASTLTYDWNFGDGAHTAVKDPTHIYSSNGPFTVILKAISTAGCVDSSTQVLSSFNDKPVVAFALPQNICMPNGTASFLNNSTLPNGSAASLVFDWNFGDGNHSGITNPDHIYTTTGPFTIILKASSPQGCVDSSSQVLSSFLNKPVVAFTLPQNICMPNGDAVFVNNSQLPNGNVSALRFDWSFGDGNQSVLKDPTHIYAAAGSFTVKLKAISTQGCVDSSSQTLSSFANKPVAGFILPQAICMPGGNASFTNSSTLPGGNISSLLFDWNFGDGNRSNSINPVHVYPSNGPFTIVLKATTPQGCIDSSKKILSAFSNKPTAAFDLPAKLCAGEPVMLTDKSVGNIASWYWVSGNGGVSANRFPAFSYSQPGSYTARLAVTNSTGCTSDTTNNIITIYDQPTADAGPSLTGHAGSVFNLRGTMSDPTLTVRWSPAIYLSDPAILTPASTTPVSQGYRLTVTGPGNCTAADSAYIKILQDIKIPNAFSPNGDGLNDVWRIPFLVDYPLATLEIYNRWGQVVYRQAGNPKPWDGKHNGTLLPTGAYYYIIDTKDAKYGKYNGSVVLLR